MSNQLGENEKFFHNLNYDHEHKMTVSKTTSVSRIHTCEIKGCSFWIEEKLR